jgi:uncharacterized protein (TIGR02186 family)
VIRLALLAIATAAALAPPARAEQVIAALSQDTVSISTSFDGSEILVYGAIKRDRPVPDGAPLAVVVTIAGPEEPVTVRRKERRFGIWVNTEAVEVQDVPTFYAVASSAPLAEALSVSDDRRDGITPTRALQAEVEHPIQSTRITFLQALIRVREAAGTYVMKEGAVALRDDTLFSGTIDLPSDLTEGNYLTQVFLTRGGIVVDRFETSIFVQKVGLERFIYNLAHERPLIYGLLSLAIAIAAGWGAAAIFRVIRV